MDLSDNGYDNELRETSLKYEIIIQMIIIYSIVTR